MFWKGNFNISKISFPIKCTAPLSILEIMPESQSCSPLLLNFAASISDPIERLRLVMVNSIAFFYPSKICEKPLNPILGETYQAFGQDGSSVFMEQTSHHPPTTHIYVDGPNKSYTFHGWSTYEVTPYPNSIVLTAPGWKEVRFKDG